MAWEALKQQVSSISGVAILETMDGPEDFYLHATVPTVGSLSSLDDM
jgi:hypothetical protein